MKLKHKIIIHLLLVSIPCVAAIGIFSFLSAKHHVHGMMDFEYMGSVEEVKESIKTSLEHVERDLRFLASISSILGLVRTKDDSGYDSLRESSEQKWQQEELESILEQKLRVDDRYVQASFVDTWGTMPIRVDRGENGSVQSVALDGSVALLDGRPEDSLYSRMKEPAVWTPNTIHVSPVALNTRQNAVASPSMPVLRYVAPVMDAAKENVLGFVSLGISLQSLFDTRHKLKIFDVKDAGNLFITDNNGFYLYHGSHPDGVWSGPHDLQPEDGLARDYPDAAVKILSTGQGIIDSGKSSVFYSRINISDGFFLIIGLDAPRETVEAPLREFETVLFYATVGTLALTWLFSAIFARHILMPIHALSAATKIISHGDFQIRVEVDSKDELQELAESFNTMANALNKKSAQLQQAIEKVKEASLDTIHRLSRAAESRDEDTGAHLQRMSHYSAAIARQMGLNEKTTEAILYAAPMHDVGKIAIPDRILLKSGKLTSEEWEIMRMHPAFGAQILEGSREGFIKLAEVIALTHHEKWDGSGYPRGLKGRKIPLVGRITALADVFDALTSRRPYKTPFPLEDAFAVIRESRGKHFDPQVVDAFFAVQDEIIAIKEEHQDEGECLLVQMAPAEKSSETPT